MPQTKQGIEPEAQIAYGSCGLIGREISFRDCSRHSRSAHNLVFCNNCPSPARAHGGRTGEDFRPTHHDVTHTVHVIDGAKATTHVREKHDAKEQDVREPVRQKPEKGFAKEFPSPKNVSEGLKDLPEREMFVAQRLAEGMSGNKIAEILNLSPYPVSIAVRNIHRILGFPAPIASRSPNVTKQRALLLKKALALYAKQNKA